MLIYLYVYIYLSICIRTKTLCTRLRLRIPLVLYANPTVVDPLPGRRHPPVIRFLSELFVVIYLFVALLFLRIGRDDAVADDAVYEAEDPEGLVNEGMPPSLDHVDPTS